MPLVQFQQAIQFEVYECANCGMPFGVSADFVERRRKDHASFHCPRGHSQSFDQESEAERLRRMLTEANAKATALAQRAANAEAAEQKAETARRKLEKRVRAGVCPCCSRSFINLKRHMATKHPEKAA
jgi:5,10-methylenetetrahydrofolate reductase